jgi:hypothetical protein
MPELLAPDGGCIEVLVNLGGPDLRGGFGRLLVWAGLQQHPGSTPVETNCTARITLQAWGRLIRPEGGLSKPHPQGALSRPIKLCSSAHPRMRTAELRTGSVAERLARSFSIMAFAIARSEFRRRPIAANAALEAGWVDSIGSSFSAVHGSALGSRSICV